MKNLVLCFGEVLWDTFGDGKQMGGAPLNVARHLLQQGQHALMVSRVGNDSSGHELLQMLGKNQLDLSLIQTDPDLPTCEVTVALNAEGHATYTIPQPVSWDNIQPADSLLEQVEQAGAIVYGSLACRSVTTRTTLLNILGNYHIPMRVFDVNLRPPHYELDTIETLSALASVVKMNEEEAGMLIRGSGSIKDKIIEFQKKYHTQTICVTQGDKGAIVLHDDEFYVNEGQQVNVMDTVGAGDSFLATLVAGLLNQQPMQQVLDRACRIGAFVASQRGANPVYPPNLL